MPSISSNNSSSNLFSPRVIQAFTEYNIASSWRKAGLIPYNPALILSTLRPITPRAMIIDEHGNKAIIIAKMPTTANQINQLVADINNSINSTTEYRLATSPARKTVTGGLLSRRSDTFQEEFE
jgi:hypothetical protein